MMPAAADLRVRELSRAVTLARMRKAWTKTVRQGMRRQVLPDLHDYLDVHRNLSSILARCRRDVLAGSYRPHQTEVVTLEKKLGMVRRLVIPSPIDALILQTLVDFVEPYARKRQPSKNAYYSRSHDGPNIEAFDGNFAYPWWALWPKFQERIWGFAKNKQFVVVTDVASYFDSIPLSKLRNAVAALGQVDESILDLLFFLVEAFVWRPVYIPNAGVGLPQLNFDAPRLLAFIYLLPADALLTKAADGSFVRWMDDIDFGVNSREEGKRILGEVDALLASLALRLNAGKTQLLSAKEATAHFWLDQNGVLNRLTKAARRASTPRRREIVMGRARTEFEAFLRSDKKGVWEKLYKRHFTLFARLRDDYLEGHVETVLRDCPALRDAAFRYFEALGFSQERLQIALTYLLGGHCVDDASFLGGCVLLVNWSVRARSGECRLIRSSFLALNVRRSARFGGVLYVLAKYAPPRSLGAFIRRNEAVWSRSPWASRQVASVLGILPGSQEAYVRDILLRHGLGDALLVTEHIRQLRALTSLDLQLRQYLQHRGSAEYAYPVQKVVLARTLLNGSLHTGAKSRLQRWLGDSLTDPVYRESLQLPQ